MIAWLRIFSLLLVFPVSSPNCTQGQERDDATHRNQRPKEKLKTDLVDGGFRALNDYSYADGVASLIEAKQAWREQRNCISCHTNGWGLAAQPIIDPRSAEVVDGRTFAQQYLTKYIDGDEKPHNQYGSVTGMVATTAFLAMSDARSGKEVHPATRKGLDNAWKLLDESGTWENWLQCNWPPFESDAEFGPTLMLVALGEVKEITNLNSQDMNAVQRLSSYLKNNPPQSLHAKTMRLWAGNAWPNLISQTDKTAWRQELHNAQATDGGWSMASLSGPAWKRDGGEGQTTTSEAYSTAFVTYVLLKTGLADQESITDKGLRWLKEHQRESGDWFTRSPRRDRKHYISRAATAFALMALAESSLKKKPSTAN
jgi:squalene-hopene/tetraprenyl-beta-curcumene cyclase